VERRTAVVTGGASGIGRAAAMRLIGAGWEVAPLDRSAEALDVAWAGVAGAHPIVADVTDRAALESAIADLEQQTGPIRGLVNSAGIYRPSQALDITDADLDAMLDVNVKGTFLPSQVVARMMAASGGGAIVNITSVAASEPTSENGAYAATKGAIDSLTRAFAVSLAPHGIRVNAVQPGPIATPMGSAATSDPGYEERMLRRVLLGRFGEPSDVAGAIAFLLGGEAAYVTGVTLRVDGGVLAHR
jgi:NAD(P)-dependent dehydrogenase (short-subunit alcohol dehydrogenase family)